MHKSIFFKKIFVSCLIIILFAVPVSAEYVRKNNFLDKVGVDRIAEIKRFQAVNNLEVTGTLNDATKEMLYNESKISYDIIETPASKDFWIVINKSRRFLTVYQGKEVIYKLPVAVGKSNSPTPSIKTSVARKLVNPAWKSKTGKSASPGSPYNPLGKRWIGLAYGGGGTYGIHGNANINSIGTYASMGCIRMFNYDVEEYVYPNVPLHSPVWIGTDQELASWGVRQIIDEKDITKKTEDPEIAEEVTSKENPADEIEANESDQIVEPEKINGDEIDKILIPIDDNTFTYKKMQTVILSAPLKSEKTTYYSK